MPTYNILIIDDQREVRRVLRAGIESLGAQYQVLDLPSAEEAILVLTLQKIDLLVIDFRLPGISGLEMMEKVRKRSPGSKMIMISGVEDMRMPAKAAEAGAEAFFAKPIDMGAFLDAIQRSLENAARSANAADPIQKAQETTQTEEVQRAEGEAAVTPDVRGLVKRFNPRLALLVNSKGKVQAYAGDASQAARLGSAAEHLSGLLLHSRRMAEALGAAARQHCFLLSGSEGYLLAGEVNEDLTAVVFLDSEPPPSWREALNDALEELRQLSPSEYQPASEEQEPKQEDEDVQIIDEDIQRVEAILNGASGVFRKQEVDRFWEDLIQENHPLKEDALSYEEARKLGLAPEDD
jgi:FixJ family two-component response regulator